MAKSDNNHIELPRTRGKTGLFGGTFDPIHTGHLQMAEWVLKKLNLDSLWFIPAASPPHKSVKAVSGFNHRAAMLELAIKNYCPEFKVSRLEDSRSGPSFTIDTLRQIKKIINNEHELFFIIGLDAFAEIDTWKNHEQLLGLAHFVVLSRTAVITEEVSNIINNFFPGYCFNKKTQAWEASEKEKKIYTFSPPSVPISSSQIKQYYADNLSIEHLTPIKVVDYIKKNNLYHKGVNLKKGGGSNG
jgi:nicotinate-nucleotide adenylyltransferase